MPGSATLKFFHIKKMNKKKRQKKTQEFKPENIDIYVVFKHYVRISYAN